MIRISELRLPTLIGVLLAVIGLASGMYLLRKPTGFAASANSEELPLEIRTANIQDTSAAISWITSRSTAGHVQYGEKGGVDVVVSDDRDLEQGTVGQYLTHHVTLKGLKPATQYYFKIGSGKKTYDNQGDLYTIRTGSTIANTPSADVIYGQVLTQDSLPGEGGIAYIQFAGSGMMSTLVKSSGSWVVPISTARNVDGSAFAAYDKTGQKIEIEIVSGSGVNAYATTTIENGSPVPTMTFGNKYDFTATANPTASKFATAQAESVDELVLLSPKLDEKINNNRPVIIGRGPAGAKITIEVHSDEKVLGETTIAANSTFTYTVPTNLSPGEHMVTISSVVDGVLKKVTRSFTVYAAGETTVPSFVATPSASLVPTLKPSPTLKPTNAPTPTKTLVPTTTVAPMVVVPPVENTPPVSGSADLTLIAILAGMILVGSGGVLYKWGNTNEQENH